MKLYNNTFRFKCCSVVLMLFAIDATAYEIDTHSNITARAFEKSVLATDQSMRALGLAKSRRLAVNGSGRPAINLGQNYYDLSADTGSGNLTPRSATLYDQLNTAVTRQGLPAAKPRWDYSRFDGQDVPYFPMDWMARGSVREDDTKAPVAIYARDFNGEQNALDVLDANPQINRFCNHFYDPVNNQAFNLGLNPIALLGCGPSEVFASAVQWAMGTAEVDGSGPPQTGRKNGFSILDAREAMWRALTGTNKQGAMVAGDRAARDAYRITTGEIA